MELDIGHFFGRPRGKAISPIGILAETSYDSGASVPMHTHRHGFFSLVVGGQLRERFERRATLLSAGSLIFHPARAPHNEAFPGERTQVFNIQPDGGWLDRLQDFGLGLPDEQRVAEPVSRLTWLAWRLRTEWRTTFQRCFGCAPGEYMRRLRVDHARRTLERGLDPLSEVALDAGFSDQSHLTRLFRRYLGTTPGSYRAAFETTGPPARAAAAPRPIAGCSAAGPATSCPGPSRRPTCLQTSRRTTGRRSAS